MDALTFLRRAAPKTVSIQPPGNLSGRGQYYPGLLTRQLALPFNPWWLLWVIVISSAWLLPTHFIPWAAFHSNLLMALALLPAAFWIVLRTARPLPVSPSVIVALLTACIPPVQLAVGMIFFAGDAWIVSTYLYGFALALLIGARFEQLAPGQLINALFAAIGAAALLSTGLVIYQWLHLSGLGLLALPFPMRGFRPFGNLGQPNNLATLLVWGLVALWWSYMAGRTRGWIAALAAAFVLFGVVVTQSRTGWLEVAVLGVAAFLYRRPLATRRYAAALGMLALFFAVLVLSWGGINHALYLDGARMASEEVSPGLRPAAWRLFLDALAQHPWRGWGWNQQAIAQYAVALHHASLFSIFNSAHNLVLDLWVENGVILGTLLALTLATWMGLMALRANTPQSCLLLLAVAVLMVHSLLEFPQNYVYFLLPVGLMMGILDTLHPARRMWQVQRWVATVLLCVGAGLMTWIAADYGLAVRSLERLRFENAHIGPLRDSKAPDLLLLTQLREVLWFWRIHPAGDTLGAAQLARMRKVVERYPSDSNLLVYAIAAGLHGQPDASRDALAHICLMTSKERCEGALAAWRSIAKSASKLAAIKVPTSPGN